MRSQAVPGIERVTTGAYERNVATGRHAAWIRITHEPGKPELLLRASGVPPERIQPLVRCVRRMFDLDADLQAAHAVLVQDPRLADAIRARPGVRIAGAWDGFEAAVAVSLRAHDSASDAASQLRGIVDRHGATVDANPPGLDRAFPSAAQLAVADLERTVGLSPLSAHTLRRLAAAVRDGRLGFGRGQQLDEFVDGFSACTSLPLRAAHEVALRALGDPNAWPVAGADDCLAWQPWRAYAAVHRSEAVATPDAVSCPA